MQNNVVLSCDKVGAAAEFSATARPGGAFLRRPSRCGSRGDNTNSRDGDLSSVVFAGSI